MPRTRVPGPVGSGTEPGAALGLEQLGRGVVRDVIAADLVRAALEQRVVEELDQLLRAVVLETLRVALVILVDAVALLAQRDRISVCGGRQRVVGVLAEHDAIGADLERALRDDHVAGERASARLQVRVTGVAGEVDRLLAIGLLGVRRCVRARAPRTTRSAPARRRSRRRRHGCGFDEQGSLRNVVGLQRSADGRLQLERLEDRCRRPSRRPGLFHAAPRSSRADRSRRAIASA